MTAAERFTMATALIEHLRKISHRDGQLYNLVYADADIYETSTAALTCASDLIGSLVEIQKRAERAMNSI